MRGVLKVRPDTRRRGGGGGGGCCRFLARYEKPGVGGGWGCAVGFWPDTKSGGGGGGCYFMFVLSRHM